MSESKSYVLTNALENSQHIQMIKGSISGVFSEWILMYYEKMGARAALTTTWNFNTCIDDPSAGIKQNNILEYCHQS